MPFFGGGGGDYHIVGTNIKGGNLVMPIVTGDSNMGLGNGALQYLTSGYQNIAIGPDTFNLSGPLTSPDFYNNIGIGYLAGYGILTGELNIAIGSMALYSEPNNGSFMIGNIGVGCNSFSSIGTDSSMINAEYNIAIGDSAASDFLYGNDNVFIGGNLSAYHFRTGSRNIVLGQANFYQNTAGNPINEAIVIGFSGNNSDINLDSQSILIGSNLSQNNTTLLTDIINVGNNNNISFENSIVLGNSISLSQSNSIVIGNRSHKNVIIGTVFYADDYEIRITGNENETSGTSINISGGEGIGTDGNGGSCVITGGQSSGSVSGKGGNVEVISGNSNVETAGDINISTGSGATPDAKITLAVDNFAQEMIVMTGLGAMGFFGATPVNKPTVTGSTGGNAALQSLLLALDSLGLINNSTT